MKLYGHVHISPACLKSRAVGQARLVVKLEVLIAAYLDELFLYITNSPTLIIAVCPELPVDFISFG